MVAVALLGCATEQIPDTVVTQDPTRGLSVDIGGGLIGTHDDPGEPVVAEPVPVVADMCDEPAYVGATWQSTTIGHFTLNYLAGTAADTDKTAIAARLEDAYATIRADLGITAEPQITVNLSPNRVAATQHNKGMGRAFATQTRYDVVYTGAADSYELQRYGQLLTVVLDFQLDTVNRYRVPVLANGVTELFDHSGRNLHDAYALQLAAGLESRVRLAELESRDVNGRNLGRAGSLVKFLVDRYGIETFGNIYRATAVTWNGSCNIHATYGCIGTPAQLTALLDNVLTQTVSESWAVVQPLWLAEINSALARWAPGMDADSTAEISNLLGLMDKAITTKDAAMYRSTIEGFYCEWGGESARDEIADRAIQAFGTTATHILALYPTGTKNFATAQAFAMRTDDHDLPVFQTIQFEHLPIGWRVSYSPDWY